MLLIRFLILVKPSLSTDRSVLFVNASYEVFIQMTSSCIQI